MKENYREPHDYCYPGVWCSWSAATLFWPIMLRVSQHKTCNLTNQISCLVSDSFLLLSSSVNVFSSVIMWDSGVPFRSWTVKPLRGGSQLQLTELTCSRSTQELRRRTSEGKPENNFPHKRWPSFTQITDSWGFVGCAAEALHTEFRPVTMRNEKSWLNELPADELLELFIQASPKSCPLCTATSKPADSGLTKVISATRSKMLMRPLTLTLSVCAKLG